MTLSQPNKQERLLSSPTRLSLLIARWKPENVLEMTDATARMDSSEHVTRVVEGLSNEMNLVSYIYDAEF